MRRETKRKLCETRERINNLTSIKSLFNGELDDLLNIDVIEITQRFNSGDATVLDDPIVIQFINSKETLNTILACINKLKKFLAYKEEFLQEIEQKKNSYTYNPNEILVETYTTKEWDYIPRRDEIDCPDPIWPETHDVTYSGYSTTYQDMLNTFDYVEQLLNDDRLYRYLDFFNKYESLRESLKERKRLFDTMKNNVDRCAELKRILSKEDDNIGIIQVASSHECNCTDFKGIESTVGITVGTEQDIKLNEFLGNVLARVYHYRDFEITFHVPETEYHKRLIEREKSKRKFLQQLTDNEIGYILTEGKKTAGIMIRKSDLTSIGIDPERVGYKPIKIEIPKLKKLRGVKQSIGYSR